MTTETVTGEPFDIDRMMEMILVDVCELPDRTSPEDAPDMMLVTGDELDMIVRRAFEYVNAARLASEARSSSEVERLDLAMRLAAAHDHLSGSPTKAVTAIRAGVDMCRDYWLAIADAALEGKDHFNAG